MEVSLRYENLPIKNNLKLIEDRTYYEKEIKLILNRYNNFGYYVANVLSVFLDRVDINFAKETRVYIHIVGELIHLDDYYNTIGLYRLAWDNICVKQIYSKQELIELADNLQLEYEQGDDLCEIIGEKVNNLSWNDFNED
jgi:hypothetical protein